MRLIWSRPARDDLFAIADYYEQIDPALSEDMLARIEIAPLALLDHPQIGSPTRRRGARKWLVKQTPYLLFYAVASTQIEIRRVRHGATNWRDEL